jgi:hypothetical protein
MKNRNRAWRRAQKQLNKSRRIKLCSCWMCGNPRKFFKGDDKLTIQERKQLESEKLYDDEDHYDSYYTHWASESGYYDSWGYEFWEEYLEKENER